jgi:hypothetical protein
MSRKKIVLKELVVLAGLFLLSETNVVAVEGGACENICCADFNNDGIVSTPDLDLFEAEYYTFGCDRNAENPVPPAPGCCLADGNNDGIVSTPDLDLFEEEYYHLCPDWDPCPNVP